MFSSNEKSSVQPRNGGITFGKPARRVYNDASATYETSNFTRSTNRTNRTLSYTKPSYLSKPAVNASANIPGNGLKCSYEPANTGNDTLPKRSKYLSISTGSSAVPQVMLRNGCTVELRGIPKWMNTIGQLDSHFSEYGRLMDIKVCYLGDPGAATVTFSNHAEASAAQRSTNMGFTNGSWSFKAPNSATVPCTTHRRGTYKMPPVDMAKHKFIRKEETKVDDLQKRKQELLEQYSKQLKVLKDIIAKCGPNDPAREGKLNMIKGLMSSMESIKASVSIVGVREQAKVRIEGKSKVPDNAVVKQMAPTNNQLSIGQSEVPADKEQRQNSVNKLNKVGSEAQMKIEACYPKLSTQLNDVTIVHASSTSVIHSPGSSGISYVDGSLRVEEIVNIEQLGQATAKDTLDYSIKVGGDNIGLQQKIETPKLSTQLHDVDVVHVSSMSNNHSSGNSGISYKEGSLRVEETGNIDQLGQATAKDTLDYSLLDYEYEYPDLSGDWE
ncbi:uncharacterized protein LOC119647652 [Hermetia illucens]|uniref:uncharacterized protein LOC119647652 n=1 Tax=Hermetia illucens TaxID=343691 RepID=UPI0018CC3A7E|nr:uncharacterized protein LOC119647652 [Hermetia illucens]